jgi:hypothetical protein
MTQAETGRLLMNAAEVLIVEKRHKTQMLLRNTTGV